MGNTEPDIRRAAESVLGGFVPSRQHRFADFQLQGTLSGSAGGLQPQLGLPALERFPPFSARTGGCGIHCPRGDAENGGNRSNVAIIRSSLTAVALFPHLGQSTKYTCSLDVTAQAQCQRRATAGVWFGASRVTQPHVSLAQGRASQRYWLWREVRGTCVSG